MDSDVRLSRQQRELGNKSSIKLYRHLNVGNRVSLVAFIGFELYSLILVNLGGLLGYGLRSLALPLMLGASIKRPAVGRGVTFRRPSQIHFGKKVVVDDYATLDVREEGSIRLGSHVFMGRFSSIVAKNAQIVLGDAVNIGTNCRIASQSRVEIGASTLIAAFSYIGPGNHKKGDADTAMIEQEMDLKGGVTIGSHCWIGTGVTILDGVTIGDGSVIGAHSLVRTNLPAGSVAVGTPAKIIGKNRANK
jgi:acetyltransferase-like isoleucine patch superfamily enzyme